jgi:isocitrate/isopropylmalate dehydrogenase
MLLDHLARTKGDPAPASAALLIEAAVARTLATGQAITTDMGGHSSTRAATTAIRHCLLA